MLVHSTLAILREKVGEEDMMKEKTGKAATIISGVEEAVTNNYSCGRQETLK